MLTEPLRHCADEPYIEMLNDDDRCREIRR
jgi:hypothetical protein